MVKAFKRSAVSWELRRALRKFRESSERAAEYRFYQTLIRKDAEGCIVDVGASSGNKTEIFRTLGSRVVAVEPDPVAAEVLRRRFKWRTSVHIRQCAVADVAGTIPFYSFQPGSAFNTANYEWAQSLVNGTNHMRMHLSNPDEIAVTAVTIAVLEEEFHPIKYLKIDAEGFEQKIISVLWRPIPLISMEFSLPLMANALPACVAHLQSLGGYRFNAAITEPPRALEFDPWLDGSELVHMIGSRSWTYSEVFARLDWR
jgi:FkbM family methyltransferase